MSPQRIFKPFPVILIPVFKDFPPDAVFTLARQLAASHLVLLGVVIVEPGISLASGSLPARKLRKILVELDRHQHLGAEIAAVVAYDRWEGLNAYLDDHHVDLVMIDWPAGLPGQQEMFPPLTHKINADLALVRGQPASGLPLITVPLRGGPHAQLALRLSLALPHGQVTALHLRSPDTREDAIDAPFRGISRILPNLPEVNYIRKTSFNPVDEIVDQARRSDLVVIGMSEPGLGGQKGMGAVAERLIQEGSCAVVMVKSHLDAPREFTGREAELSGAQAISILVDKWFAENTYHASEFDAIADLVRQKQEQNLTISLALPALNEQETVGKVITAIQKTLVEKYPLLDEIVLIDSNSKDRTRQIAESLGVPVFIHQDILPHYGARDGKGDALWKSLYVTSSDILVWIDSDIVNIHPRFVYGVLGPLLANPGVQFVKGFYQRPLRSGRRVQSTGGGRVTELTARPLLNLFYPELSGVIQPLSGEYGGRRKALENLTFFSGYGVETGLLIDVFEKYGLAAIAQVDLLERIHHNQTLTALSKMSFAIIQTVLKKLEERIQHPLFEDVNRSMKLVQYYNGNYNLEVKEIVERERPPMIGLPEYHQRFYPSEPYDVPLESLDSAR